MNWLFLLFPFLTPTTAPVSAPMMPSPDAAAPPAIERTVSAQPLSCELRQITRGGRHVLMAVVQAQATVAGEYTFTLKGTDANRNQVKSSTGDAFRTQAGERLELEGPSVSLGRGTALKTQLELQDSHKRTLASCSL
jgi:hypothetical protein